MPFDLTTRAGIATAKRLLKSNNLMPKVAHASWDGATRDSAGNPVLGSPANRDALVEDVDVKVRTTTETIVTAKTKVTFLENVTVNAEDRITLPDGRTGPLLNINRGVLDKRGVPLLVEVYF